MKKIFILILCAIVLNGCDDKKLNEKAGALASNTNTLIEDARAFYKVFQKIVKFLVLLGKKYLKKVILFVKYCQKMRLFLV